MQITKNIPMKEWPREEKLIFMFSMLFLLIVTVSIVSVTQTAFIETQIGAVQLSPGENIQNSPLTNELRKGYLFTLFSMVGLFFTIFYYAILWPKKK